MNPRDEHRPEATTLPGLPALPAADRWDTPEPARRDLYDMSAWVERMAWRNVFLGMFVIGVVSFALGFLDWIPAAALALGGLVPGLFLMAGELIDRNLEADRQAALPETRHDGTLPPLRRRVTVRSADYDDPADGR